MKIISEKLARMPRFINSYKKIIHIIAVILFLPFAFLLAALIGVFTSIFFKEKDDPYIGEGLYQSDKDRGALTTKEIEETVIRWANTYTEKFDCISNKQVTTTNNSYLEINLSPKNAKALSICFEIGGQVMLFVRFINNRNNEIVNGLEFDTENDRGYKSINTTELENILECYLKGDYYIIYSLIDERVVASELHMRNSNVNYTDYSGEPCIFERKIAIQKKIEFDPL